MDDNGLDNTYEGVKIHKLEGSFTHMEQALFQL
jgi:hypothetical protein